MERDRFGTAVVGVTGSGVTTDTFEDRGTTGDATSSVGRTEASLGRIDIAFGTGILEGAYNGIGCFSGTTSNVELEEEAVLLLWIVTSEFTLRVRFGTKSGEWTSLLANTISTIHGVTTSVPWNRESRPPTENTFTISCTKTRKRVCIALSGGIERCDSQKKQTQYKEWNYL